MSTPFQGRICFSKKIGLVVSLIGISFVVIALSYSAVSQKTHTQSRAAVPPPKQPSPPVGSINKTVLTFSQLVKQYGDRITEEEKESMKKYVNPRIVVWHVSKKPDFTNNTIVLGGGLSSNSTQWEKGTGLIHQIFFQLRDRAIATTIVAIECPGFGNAEIKKSLITEDAVSSRTYARDYWTWVKILGLKPENTILSGHSSGGEAVLMLTELADFNSDYKIYALNPAVHTDVSQPFTTILMFEEISYAAKNYIDQVVNTVAHYLTKYYILAGGKVASITSSDPLVAEQMKVHDEEFQKFDAFWKKSNELVHPDTLDPINYKKENITFLFPVGDRLTPGADGVAYIQKYLQMTDADINAQSIYIADTENFGHDALFYKNTVAEQTARAMIYTLFPDFPYPTPQRGSYNLVSELRTERKFLTQTYVAINEIIIDAVKTDLLIQLATQLRTNKDNILPVAVSSKIETFLKKNNWSASATSDNGAFIDTANRIQYAILNAFNTDAVVIEEDDISQMEQLRQKIIGDPVSGI